MEFLGAFLSPSNSIQKDSDTLTKYFYFRPDQYDDPEADLENIFALKAMAEFPQRYDVLEENTDYAIDSIEVSKRVSDEETGVKKVSYVVTCTYDTIYNIQKKEGSGSSSNNNASSNVIIDENDKLVDGKTKPWDIRASWSFTPQEVVIPFTQAYNANNEKVVNVINTAGNRLLAETQRFRLEINYSKSFQNANEFSNILEPYINNENIELGADGVKRIYPSGTLLMQPPTITRNYFEEKEKKTVDGKEQEVTKITPYFTYNIKLTYDPEGWNMKLLNIGTFAKFGTSTKAEQIYSLTVTDENGALEQGPTYTNAAGVLKAQGEGLKSGKIVSAEAVTEPLPLTSTGKIYDAAISSPETVPYLILNFRQYKSRNFLDLPWAKKKTN